MPTFTERDASDASELRGTLEGLAARMAAERGCSTVVLNDARACLDVHDAVFDDRCAQHDAAVHVAVG